MGAPAGHQAQHGHGGHKAHLPTAAGRDDTVQRLTHLVRAYQVRGHEQARLDPLELNPPKYIPELDPATYGFSEQDLSQPLPDMQLAFENITGFLGGAGHPKTIGDLLDLVRSTYCSTIGLEYMHIRSREECNWIRSRFEVPPSHVGLTAKQRSQLLDRVCFADTFEAYMDHKYNTTKRFGLEGCETLIPGLKSLIDHAVHLGVQDIVIGMPHRGRVNVLANVIRKPLEVLFKEFQGEDTVNTDDEALGDWSVSGDVKYHLGTSYDRTYPDGQQVHLSLAANPSHLEAVNPVVVGKARAKQFYSNDVDGHRTMPLLMHGDASFAGQGIVYETMHFASLEQYSTGGTVHVVCNNQIGFTTDPVEARSSAHCTDVGKAFGAPVLHVNADDPEAVMRVFQVAAEWRQTFHKDVIIDLIGYRRSGHNELDQPSFTQPRMYSKIKEHPPVMEKYSDFLVQNGHVSAEEVAEVRKRVRAVFDDAFEKIHHYDVKDDWLESRWSGFKGPGQLSRIRETGVERDRLDAIGRAVATIPDEFVPHRTIKKIYEQKKKMVHDGEGLDWGTAEALAFGTLLGEDNHVRISGQDVERGTFSHRHAVLHDQRDNNLYVPLNHLERLGAVPRQAEFVATNSPLSEFGTLGFELGYSLESPNQLVLWEAQFGDFVNGAQVVIDQFLSSGEDKWLRQTGLTLLLPHGYDGQGAEHSSCRVERFLQNSDEPEDEVPSMREEESLQVQRTNWQVCNISTPANYFHALRRQIHRDFRKPLIIASPKNLLRHKLAHSTLDEMAAGTRFQRVIGELEPDKIQDPGRVRRVILCTGKLYYELLSARREQQLDDIALVRVEQLAPFPFDVVAGELAKYENAEVMWCQEEPQNMGYWSHVRPRVENTCTKINDDKRALRYVGRRARASPAVGYGSRHKEEQAAILHEALS